MKLDNLYSFNPDLKEERIIDKKTFFCSSIGRLLDYAKVLGKIRFVYDPIISKFAVGNAENFTHIGLFANSIKAGNYDDKFDEYDNDDKDEYYGGNIEGPELTGAIIMKNHTKNILSDMPDTTTAIFEYSMFYLCNGLWFKDKISEYVNETPKQFY